MKKIAGTDEYRPFSQIIDKPFKRGVTFEITWKSKATTLIHSNAHCYDYNKYKKFVKEADVFWNAFKYIYPAGRLSDVMVWDVVKS